MSDRKLESDTKTIHPRALYTLGLEACVVMLGVARDLREGTIRDFYMVSYFNECGSPCCIGGHLLARLGYGCNTDDPVVPNEDGQSLLRSWLGDPAIAELFGGGHPSDPQLAARAIERYVVEGKSNPWGSLKQSDWSSE